MWVHLKLKPASRNHSELSIALIFSQPAYFEQIIKPLLAPGQDAQLVSWLRNVGLLPQTRTCKNSSKNVCCNNSSMQLIPTSTADFYQWICPNCLEKKKIREDTIFHNIKCKFNDAVRLFWEWSQGNDHEMMADVLSECFVLSIISFFYERQIGWRVSLREMEVEKVT